MEERTRESIKEITKQFHNDCIAAIDNNKLYECITQSERWAKERKEAQAQEKARIDRARRGDYTKQEKAAQENALKGVIKDLNKQINHNLAKQADFWDRFNKSQAAQEGREEIERLLEIANNRNDYLKARLEEAEARENEELIEKYTQEIEENSKNLDFYSSKYQEYKADRGEN